MIMRNKGNNIKDLNFRICFQKKYIKNNLPIGNIMQLVNINVYESVYKYVYVYVL